MISLVKYNNGFSSTNALSKEVGIHQATLSRWLRDVSAVSSSMDTLLCSGCREGLPAGAFGRGGLTNTVPGDTVSKPPL